MIASQQRNAESPPPTPSPTNWRRAVGRVRRRDIERPANAAFALPAAGGRWSALSPPDPDAANTDAAARQLLQRYGVVFRDLVARESALPPWRELLIAFRRMEARGEVRGGRFVTGFVGEQYALREAIGELRAMRTPPNIPELVYVSATDPLNLVGITSPGAKVAAVLGNRILYKNGVPIASMEAGEVVIRHALEPGARVDGRLIYFAAPEDQVKSYVQTTLPLR